MVCVALGVGGLCCLALWVSVFDTVQLELVVWMWVCQWCLVCLLLMFGCWFSFVLFRVGCLGLSCECLCFWVFRCYCWETFGFTACVGLI